MKKLLSFLIAMTMTACAFTSCGSKDDDDSKKGSSVSDEEKGGENSALGKWKPVADEENSEDLENVVFDIQSEDKATISMVQDMSEDIYFDDKKSFFFTGMEFGDDNYDFDGKTFVLHAFSENDLTMEKIDGSDDLFGEYKWINGDAYDAMAQGFGDSASEDGVDADFENTCEMYMTCGEGSTSLEIRFKLDDFKLTDDTISISSAIFGEDSLENAPYTIDGDTMTLTNAKGKDVQLKRIS